MVLFTHCVISKIKPGFWGVPHLHGIHGIGGTTYQWAICWNRARKSKSVWSLACPSVLICWFPKSEMVQEPPIRTGFQQLSTTNSWQISRHVHWKDYTNGNLPQMADIMIEEGSYVVMSFLKGLNCFQGPAVTAGFKGSESAIHIRSQFDAWWFLMPPYVEKWIIIGFSAFYPHVRIISLVLISVYIPFRRHTVSYLILFLKQRFLDQKFLSHTSYSRMSFHEILLLSADMSQWTMCSWCVHCPFSICAAGVKLFVSAVGVPPKWLVDKLHGAGIICMNLGTLRMNN